MISIVVPIFNAEKYLYQCVESILCHDNSSMELILVNDGSTDQSLAICEAFARRDPRVIVIDKNNGGVSETRNMGIAAASGEYILFADADDYYVPNALRHIVDALDSCDVPDILIWGYTVAGTQEGNNDTAMLRHNAGGFSRHDLLKRLICIDPQNRLIGVIWRCAFKRELLMSNHILFNTDLKKAEDFKFMVDTIMASNAIAVLDKELYVYRVNNDSTTARYKSNVHSDMLWINQWMEREICGVYPDIQKGLDCCCAETYIVAIQNLCSTGTPFSVMKRIHLAWEMRRQYQYGKRLWTALGQFRQLRLKRVIVFLMLCLYLEPLYIILYSLKRKTILPGNK